MVFMKIVNRKGVSAVKEKQKMPLVMLTDVWIGSKTHISLVTLQDSIGTALHP